MAAALHVRGVVLPAEEHRDLWVRAGRVTYDPVPGAETITPPTGTSWVVPGLVDAHCHIGLAAGGAVDAEETRAQAERERAAGVLLVRDAGSPADTRWIDEQPELPRIIRAGRHIARTRRYIRNFAWEIEPADLVAYVRQEALRGDGWVKLVGDWIERDAGDLAPCWPLDALTAAIAEAHRLGARVTAHVFGELALPDLLAAGIDCIEHGTGLSDDTIAAMAARDVALVPTLVNIARFPDIAAAGEAKFPAYASHLRALHERRYATVRAAHEAGVRVFAGTDAGGSLPHGLIGDEVHELVRAGLSPEHALGAASWDARGWLGRPALAEGDPADLVVLDADPRAEPDTLRRPVRIVLRGTVVG